MAVNALAALFIIIYYITIVAVGVWSGRQLHAQPPGQGKRSKEKREDYLLKLLISNRVMTVTVGFASMTGQFQHAKSCYGHPEITCLRPLKITSLLDVFFHLL